MTDVTGVEIAAEPVFSPELIREDGRNRIGRTAGQGGGAYALVTVGQYVAQQAGWRHSLPSTVFGSVVVLMTIVAAWLSNRTKLRA